MSRHSKETLIKFGELTKRPDFPAVCGLIGYNIHYVERRFKKVLNGELPLVVSYLQLILDERARHAEAEYYANHVWALKRLLNETLREVPLDEE
jgi:hypothetical protein